MVEGGSSAQRDGPQWIGPFRILGELGRGGMGVVHLAEQQEPVVRRVALKVMRDDLQGSEFLARFEMERRALERMEHPNIARVLGAGVTDDGRPWFVMEYVQGLPVDRYCDKKRLSIPQRLELFTAICAGVQHAHTNGIMHRDLKPGNVLVTEVDDRPVPKIIDFGLARAIGPHRQRATLFEELQRVVGTLAYMSPEQAGLDADGIDARTDVYSLGVMLYELLTGRLPFEPEELERAGPLGLQQIIREREPQRPSTRYSEASAIAAAKAEDRRGDPASLWREVAGELDWIVLKALAKDRTQRYVTARDLARDIERHLRDEPVEAGPPSAAYRARKWLRRHRFGVALGGVAALGVLATLTVGFVIAADLAVTRADLLQRTTEALLVGDPQVRASLEAEADRLWPAMPANVPMMQRWLEQARAVNARRALHQQFLADPAAQRDAALAARLAEHVEALAVFGGTGGRIEQLERRLADASTIAARTTEGSAADAWAAARERVRANPRYSGIVELTPQIGLLPLGADPGSMLEEFAVVQSGELPVRAASGTLQLTDESAIVLVLIPGGAAAIGASAADGPHLDPQAESREGPVQSVRLDPYFLSKYELTQAQWERAIGVNAARFRPDPFYEAQVRLGRLPAVPTKLHPVETVAWQECADMLRRFDLELPTEAQWEFAARAGSSAPWYFGAGAEGAAAFGRHANIADAFAARFLASIGKRWKETDEAEALGIDDGFLMTAPVGSLLPNANGLHDVHGNVWEWCRDPHDDGNYGGGLRDGDGCCNEGEIWDAVLRGGGYCTQLRYTRVSYREATSRDSHFATHGVRPARRYDP